MDVLTLKSWEELLDDSKKGNKPLKITAYCDKDKIPQKCHCFEEDILVMALSVPNYKKHENPLNRVSWLEVGVSDEEYLEFLHAHSVTVTDISVNVTPFKQPDVRKLALKTETEHESFQSWGKQLLEIIQENSNAGVHSEEMLNYQQLNYLQD